MIIITKKAPVYTDALLLTKKLNPIEIGLKTMKVTKI